MLPLMLCPNAAAAPGAGSGPLPLLSAPSDAATTSVQGLAWVHLPVQLT